MFTFVDDYTFDYPVKVRFPSPDGERIEEFTATFRLPSDELEIFADLDAKTAAAAIEADRARLAGWIVGWSGIAVETGGELPFSAENRDKLLRIRPFRIAVNAAISEAVLGIPDQSVPGMREKN